ncbi:MAG: YtxH domain-containing protein [Prevotellaceae bacterium]|jgi:gas vesicle protein|nr:YtxH domain-containing protein [Prevotellaceae bacterium]
MSNVGKDLLILVGGVAVGAALGILFAPAKGTVTRRKIARTTRDFKDSIVDKLEELVESTEEIVDEFRESAAEFIEPHKTAQPTNQRKK